MGPMIGAAEKRFASPEIRNETVVDLLSIVVVAFELALQESLLEYDAHRNQSNRAIRMYGVSGRETNRQFR